MNLMVQSRNLLSIRQFYLFLFFSRSRFSDCLLTICSRFADVMHFDRVSSISRLCRFNLTDLTNEVSITM